MPRKARMDTTGSLHHIIVRGIDRMPIFKDPLDYRDFLEGPHGSLALRDPCLLLCLRGEIEDVLSEMIEG